MRPALGITITAATIVPLIIAFLRRRRFAFSLRGKFGLPALAIAEILMFRHVWPVNVYFTPIAWTCYLLVSDSMVQSITGRSRMTASPRAFLICAALSIPLWTIFELYNLRLQNWTYVGVPVSWAGALLGYGWSFATITPAILETADLIEAMLVRSSGSQFRAQAVGSQLSAIGKPKPDSRQPIAESHFSSRTQLLFVLFGAACLFLPLLIPQHTAAYLFALVWIGFVFLLDPINYWRGRPSLIGDLERGYHARFYSLLLSGWICGWLWEFWNNWAAAKWQYIFPIAQDWKIFEMPAPGFLGFLPFALECFVMYVSASALLRMTPLE